MKIRNYWIPKDSSVDLGVFEDRKEMERMETGRSQSHCQSQAGISIAYYVHRQNNPTDIP